MFFGDLSAHSERKARQAAADKKPSPAKITKNVPLATATTTAGNKSTEASTAIGEGTPLLSVEPTEENIKKSSLIYTTSNPDIPRDVILQFFRYMIETLSLESTYDDLLNRSETENIPLDAANVLLQTDAMENIFHIEKQFGCKYLAQLPESNRSDPDLVEMGKHFTYASVEGFVNAIRYRKRKQGLSLRTTGGMSRFTLLEFFELCNALMVLKSTKATLKAAYEETRKPPNQLIIDMQHGCLEDLGLDYTYGVSCLNRVGQDYPNDRGVMMKMNQFALGANLACQEAMMSQEQREEFYQEIPIFMHNFPHIYVFQKRMMEQQQQAQQQQAAGEAQSYFKTAEGMQKMQALSARIQVAKGEAEGSVTGWDAEKRLEYFRSFQDHPALSQMKNSSGDVREKISAFMDLSDSDLTDMMKMQLVLAEDMKSGGSIVKEMQAGGVSKSMMGHMQSMRMMMGSGGTSSEANTHVHGPNCQHHSAGPVAPDVSTGKGDSMER